MFKDVQRLKVQELEDRIANLKAEQEAMASDVRTLELQLNQLQETQQRDEKNLQGQTKFTAWERLVTKRKAYREYQTKLAELKKLAIKISKLISELEIAKMQLEEKMASSGILDKIMVVEEKILFVEKAQSLAELDITPEKAMAMLEQNNIQPLLDESDRQIFERPRNYRTTDDLIAVHKMDLMPTGSRLSTLAEDHVQKTETITLDGKEYQYSYELERNTMHVSLNDEVSSHLGGNWDNCHYTVLQPFGEMDHTQIGSAMPNDTYTRGGIALTKNAWILCPAAEVETVKQLNPQVHVLGYQGENAKGLAAPFLSQLGYRAESVGQWGWEDQTSQQQFFDVVSRANLQTVQHDNSTDVEDEEYHINTNQAIGLFKMLRDENLLQTAQDFTRLQPQLENQVGLSGLLSHALKTSGVDGKTQKDYRNRDAVVAGGRQVKTLASKMARAGMPLAPADLAVLQNRFADNVEGTDHAKYVGAGKELTNSECVARAMANSAIRSRDAEQSHDLAQSQQRENAAPRENTAPTATTTQTTSTTRNTAATTATTTATTTQTNSTTHSTAATTATTTATTERTL